MCVVYIYYVYIYKYTCMYRFQKNMLILYIKYIYFYVNYINIDVNILYVCVYLNKQKNIHRTHIYIMKTKTCIYRDYSFDSTNIYQIRPIKN